MKLIKNKIEDVAFLVDNEVWKFIGEGVDDDLHFWGGVALDVQKILFHVRSLILDTVKL